jgi:hypothetical protein
VTGPDPRSVCLFLHIPKTAGTTLKHCIYEHHSVPGPSDDWFHEGVYYFPYGFHKARRPRFTPRVRAELARDDLRAVVGHFWYGVHDLVPQPSFYVTLLREPVDRVVSLYHHILGKDGELYHSAIVSRGATLEEFVVELACRETDNDQTRRIAGAEPAFGRCTRRLLERAKSNLRDRFAFVGITERFDESLVALKRLLGWPYLFYFPELVNRARPPRSALSPATVALVSERNSYDLELYAFAGRLLQERIDAEGPSFTPEVERFRAQNGAYIDRYRPGARTA